MAHYEPPHPGSTLLAISTYFISGMHLGVKISTGVGGSKLMTSLVNVTLIFQTLIIEIRHHFLLKKCLFFSTKNISVFGYKVVKHLMS